MDKLKVAIICSENQKSWIIGKFANQLKFNLEKLGFIADILEKPSVNYDINHHVYHGDFIVCKDTISTFMITHIDTEKKLLRLKQLIDLGELGICMSKHTAEYLVGKGIVSNKITYIHPAHDENFLFKKIKIGVFSNIYDDSRKNENWIVELSNKISNTYFEFIFLGQGWGNVTNKLIDKNFVVTNEEFNYEKYKNYLNIIDYWVYMGFDEGSMSFLDAQQTGTKIICSNQGFHNDMKKSVEYLFSNKNEFFDIFVNLNKLQSEKHNYALNNTWQNFTLKHIELWNYLLNNSIESKFKKEGLDYLIEEKKEFFFKKGLLEVKLFRHKIIKKLKNVRLPW